MPACYGNPPAPYPGFLIRQGSRGDAVRQIQTCLNTVNNAGLATDGIFGPLTNAAVVNYQRANGLVPDGIVGPLTWANLMRRCACRNIMPATTTAAAPAAVEITPVAATEIETVPVADIDQTSLGIEYSPNFAALDETGTEFIEESLGTVAPAGDSAISNTDDAEQRRELIRLLIRELEK